MESQAELVAELQGWCQGEKIDEAHALLALLPEDLEVARVEETLQTVKCLGRVHFRGRIFHRQRGKFKVLCECEEVIQPRWFPWKYCRMSATSHGPSVVGDTPPAQNGEFWEKLEGFMRGEDRTIEDLLGLYPAPNPAPNNDSVLLALDELLH